jgi:hypothetical protein
MEPPVPRVLSDWGADLRPDGYQSKGPQRRYCADWGFSEAKPLLRRSVNCMLGDVFLPLFANCISPLMTNI